MGRTLHPFDTPEYRTAAGARRRMEVCRAEARLGNLEEIKSNACWALNTPLSPTEGSFNISLEDVDT